MADMIMSLFSTEVSAQEKVNIVAELFAKLFEKIFGYMDIDATIETE